MTETIPPEPAHHEGRHNAFTDVAATFAEVAQPGSNGRKIAVSAAVGIGSAAIVAALLFTGGNRLKR